MFRRLPIPARTTCCPVTALCFVDNFLFAGQGGRLLVYRLPDSKLLLDAELFEVCSINALVASESQDSKASKLILACAGSYVRAILLKSSDRSSESLSLDTKIGPTYDCFHRVLSASFSPYIDNGSPRRAAVLTAQNSLLHLHIEDCSTSKEFPELAASLINELSVKSCLLFAGKLLWVRQDRILIAAGSAFGTLIVWSCGLSSTAGQLYTVSAKVIHDVEAHDGAIFGVNFCSTYQTHDLSLILAATCSDDRRIKVWGLTHDIIGHTSITGPSRKSDNKSQNSMLVTEGIKRYWLIAQTWAHASRIWQIILLGRQWQVHDFHISLHVLSVGEDARTEARELQVQLSEGKMSSANGFSLLSSDVHHEGKNIWAFATTLVTDQTYRIATGGADGAICVRQHSLLDNTEAGLAPRGVTSGLKNWLESDTRELPDLIEMRDIIETAMTKTPSLTAITLEQWGAIKSYTFLGTDSIVIISRHGLVIKGCLKASDSEVDDELPRAIRWRRLAHVQHLAGFSMSAAVTDLGFSLHVGPKGHVYYASRKSTLLKELVNVRVKVTALYTRSVEFPSSSSLQGSPTLQAQEFIIATNYIDATRYRTRVIFARMEKEDAYALQQFDLEMDKDFMMTSILCKASASRRLLIVGSRSGEIAIFKIEGLDSFTLSKASTVLSLSPDSVTNYHEDAITSMLWIPIVTPINGGFGGYLFKTSRDGFYSVHEIDVDLPESSFRLVHKSFPPLGPNIEGCFIEPDTGSLVLYGFSGRYFIVYDEGSHIETMRVDCGGAHRLWAFHPPSHGLARSPGSFAWTQASKFAWICGRPSSNKYLKAAGHGREIKTCAVSTARSHARNILLATGAEDTEIRLFEYHPESIIKELKCVRVIKKHNTGIQQLRWSKDGTYLFSSGGQEEFFIWKIQQVPTVGIGVVLVSSLPHGDETSDLRITSFDVEFIANENDLNIEDKERIHIFMALSDSTVRIYEYEITRQIWTILYSSPYATCCLTQAHLLHTTNASTTSQSESALPRILVAAATDGHLSLWPTPSFTTRSNVPSTLQHHSFQIHQNTIKEISIHPILPSRHTGMRNFLIAGCGDDNALTLTLLTLTSLTSAGGFPNDKSEEAKNSKSWHITGGAFTAPKLTAIASTLLLPRAHAAGITGIAIVPLRVKCHQERIQHFTILTAANDQKLKFWHIQIDIPLLEEGAGVEALTISRGRRVHTPVADVAGVAVFGSLPRESGECGRDGDEEVSARGKEKGDREGKTRALIWGVGMDIIDVDDWISE